MQTMTRFLIALIALSFTLAAGGCGSSSSSSAPIALNTQKLYVNGVVQAVAFGADGTTYIGGTFSRISEYVGLTAAVDTVTGERINNFPPVEGNLGPYPTIIQTTLPDGNGGFYIGGSFTRVGNIERKGLAHIRANGTVDPVWKPEVDGFVVTLARSGDSIFIGGMFTRVNGLTRTSIAVVDATLGTLFSSTPVLSSSLAGGLIGVTDIIVDGTTTYVAGLFNGAGNTSPATPRMCLAAFDANNNVLPWNPSPDGIVSRMLKIGNTLYVAGSFNNIGGLARNGLAAVDKNTGVVNAAWDPVPAGDSISIRTMAVKKHLMDPSTLLVGGRFHTIGGAAREHAAELNITTGNATSWNPNPDDQVSQLITVGSLASTTQIYVCGEFTTIGGANRSGVAEVNLNSGAAMPWNTDLSGEVNHAAILNETLYLFGKFYTSGVIRQNLAAFDRNGNLKDWVPAANAQVMALAVSGDTIYAGGSFTVINGMTRQYLAAFDTDGNLDSWDPGASGGGVSSLVVSGDTVYAGGTFKSIGTQTRNLVAAIHAVSGRPLPGWNPFPTVTGGSRIRQIKIDGNTLYAAGFLDDGGTQNVFALDAVTGVIKPWITNSGGEFFTVAVNGNTVYAGGSIGLKAYDATTGQPSASWTLGPTPSIYYMDLAGSSLYVGGSFNEIGGVSRNKIAALNLSTGAVQPWNPQYANGGNIQDIKANGSRLYIVGSYLTTASNNSTNASGGMIWVPR